MEIEVKIRCRKSDIDIVKEVLPEVCLAYINKLKTEVPKLKGKEIKPRIHIDDVNYLPELNLKEPGMPSW